MNDQITEIMKCLLKLTKLFFVWGILMCFSYSQLQAQGWIEYYGDSISEVGHRVLPTPDQGYIFAGIAMNAPNDTEPHIYLVKTDANGVEQWSNTYPTGYAQGLALDMVMNAADHVIIMVNEGNAQQERTYLTAIDLNGNQLWDVEMPYICQSMALALDGGYVFAGHNLAANRDLMLLKTDPLGSMEWVEFYDFEDTDLPLDLIATEAGKYVLLGYATGNGVSNYFLQTDGNGVMEWSDGWGTIVGGSLFFREITEDHNGNYVFGGETTVGGTRDVMIAIIDPQGATLWDYYLETPDNERTHAIAVTDDGGYLAAGIYIEAGGSNQNAMIYKLDSIGNLEWDFVADNLPYNLLSDIIVSPGGGYIGFGTGIDQFNIAVGDYTTSMMAIGLDSAGVLFSHQLLGTVAYDHNEDCLYSPDELALEGWMVKVEGDIIQYDMTDSNGVYNLIIDTGMHTLTLFPPNEYWTTCENPIEINALGFYDTTYQNILTQAVVECPLLNVDLGTWLLRPCWENNQYAVRYANHGTVPAENAYVEVELNEWFYYVDATAPLLSQDGNLYTFSLGAVDVNESGAFTIFYDTDCDSLIMGQTICTNAHIYPDSLCQNPLWGGPEISVNAECTGDSIQFTITNFGTDMTEEHFYVIIEDNIILMTQPFLLDAQESTTFGIPAEANATYALLAEQSEDYPSYLGNPYVSVTIEGCVGEINVGLFSQLTQNDGSPFYDEDCRIVRTAFDPNDKTGFPFGLGEDHLIQQDTDLDYLIRFQNIGNDTAFNIVIRDTLSPYLDLGSLQLGASSHPYTVEIRSGRVLTFNFSNILLPDSTTNELASQGWVKFHIKQERDNPIGTLIENSAAIYFDFNVPVITNRTFHQIGEDFVDLVDVVNEVEYPDLSLQVFPNPTDYSAYIQLNQAPKGDLTFKLFDATGRMLQQEIFIGNGFTFYKKGLPAGIYFFKIMQAGKWVSSGKLILK